MFGFESGIERLLECVSLRVVTTYSIDTNSDRAPVSANAVEGFATDIEASQGDIVFTLAWS
jgi:hypothetical protein